MQPPYERQQARWQKTGGQNQILLLSGELLSKTIYWANHKRLSQQDRDFLIDSIIRTRNCESMVLEEEKLEVSEIVKRLWPTLKSKTENPYSTLQEILAWTECQPFLTQRIIELISLDDSIILMGEESQKVQLIIEKHFTKAPKDPSIARHFNSLHRLVTRNERQKVFWLLFGYRKGLQAQKNSKDYDREIRSSIIFLQSIGLLIESQGLLKVRNHIYQSIFDEEWVNTQMIPLRPYTQKFVNWLDADCEDDSQLLNGKEMQDAMKWKESSGLVLTALEEKFLAYSLDIYIAN